MILKNFKELFFYFITILFFINCDVNDNKGTEDIPKDVSILLKEIKKVEYENVYKLRNQVENLKNLNTPSADFYAEYYKLKANFLEHYNLQTLKEYDAIYQGLKDRKLYRLMSEVDIFSTKFYYQYYDYKKASSFIKRSFDYCFKPNMFLERQALTYGISPTAIVNTPEQKIEEIRNALKEIKDYKWSFYHSRITYNLVLANFYLKDYKQARKVMYDLIKENKANKYNFELFYCYQLLAAIEEKITKDYKIYIEYQEKAIETKEIFGHEYLLYNYRMIGHKYFENKKYVEARDFYKKATEDKSEDTASLSVDYAYLGWAHFNVNMKENFDKANDYYNKALTYSKKGHVGYRIALERKIWSLNNINRKLEAEKYKIQLLEAQNKVFKDIRGNQLKDLQMNTMLELKSKNHNLKQLEYTNKLQKTSLKNQRILNIAYGVFMLMFLVLLYMFFINKKHLKRRKYLNTELEKSLLSIEKTNVVLNNKNEEVTKLLELNEKSLFAKVLELSTYKDAIQKLGDQLTNLINSNNQVESNQLFSIEKKLKTIFSEKEIWNDFKIQFEKTRPGFFVKLKEIAPNLSVNELKHCSYILANLRTKDVANLINVSPRSVETARYRIKKKLFLSKDDSLFDFLQNV